MTPTSRKIADTAAPWRARLLPVANALANWRAARWSGVRFLCYHSVARQDDCGALSRRTLVLSDDAFRRHLRLISENRYACVSMDEALTLLGSGRADRGQYICLTFDDGRVDNFTIAWPIIREFGFTAHFFVCPGLLGGGPKDSASDTSAGAGAVRARAPERREGEMFVEDSPPDRFMAAKALRTIIDEGGSIGSHTLTHADLPTLDDAALTQQLAGSRAALEELTGAAITTFAYPFAHYDARVLHATRQAGYLYAFGITTGAVHRLGASGSTRNLTIHRNVIRSGLDAPENYAILRGGMDFTRPYSLLRNRIATWLS